MSRQRNPARLPGQTIVCGWCRACIAVRATGQLPKWCSPSCRKRAWQQRRAAESGLAAVDVIDRVIEVEKEITVVERIEVTVPPTGAAWPAALTELARQIDTGRVYDRDLQALDQSLEKCSVHSKDGQHGNVFARDPRVSGLAARRISLPKSLD